MPAVVPPSSGGFFTYPFRIYPFKSPSMAGVPYGDGVLNRSATAGTKIRVVIPPYSSQSMSRLTKFVYTNGVTAHTLTVMRPIGWAGTTGSAAAGASTVGLSNDPGPTGNLLATNDILLIQESDGVTRLYTVNSYAAGTLTINGTFTAGVAQGAIVWNLGVEADTDPFTGAAHENMPLPASVTTTLSNEAGSLSTHVAGSPMLLTVNNITNAGTVTVADWGYTVAG